MTTKRCEQSFMAGSICTLPPDHHGSHATLCTECLADMNADDHAPGCSYAEEPSEALSESPWLAEARVAMAGDRLGHALWSLRGAIAEVERELPPTSEDATPAVAIAHISTGLMKNALGMLEAALDRLP